MNYMLCELLNIRINYDLFDFFTLCSPKNCVFKKTKTVSIQIVFGYSATYL